MTPEEINQEIADFEERAGVELTEDQWDDLGHLLEANPDADPEEFYGPAEDDIESDDAPDLGLAIQEIARSAAAEVAASHYGQPQVDPEAEFEQDFWGAVEAVERERGGRLTDGERSKMWNAAISASNDPTVENPWTPAKAAVDTDRSMGEIADEFVREAEQQEKQKPEEPPEEQTPGEALEELEQVEDEYRAMLDQAVRGEGPSPEPDYVHPDSEAV